jgi:hypothetical protein
VKGRQGSDKRGEGGGASELDSSGSGKGQVARYGKQVKETTEGEEFLGLVSMH